MSVLSSSTVLSDGELFALDLPSPLQSQSLDHYQIPQYSSQTSLLSDSSLDDEVITVDFRDLLHIALEECLQWRICYC